MVREAEAAYTLGLSEGHELKILTENLTERLDIAAALRDDALTQANLLESQFPYYVDVGKIPQVYNDIPTVTTTAPGPDDLITINDHPDILEVFDTEDWGLLLVHDGDERDHTIVDATGHSSAGAIPNVDSVLAVDTGTLGKIVANADDVVITLESIP